MVMSLCKQQKLNNLMGVIKMINSGCEIEKIMPKDDGNVCYLFIKQNQSNLIESRTGLKLDLETFETEDIRLVAYSELPISEDRCLVIEHQDQYGCTVQILDKNNELKRAFDIDYGVDKDAIHGSIDFDTTKMYSIRVKPFVKLNTAHELVSSSVTSKSCFPGGVHKAYNIHGDDLGKYHLSPTKPVRGAVFKDWNDNLIVFDNLEDMRFVDGIDTIHNDDVTMYPLFKRDSFVESGNQLLYIVFHKTGHVYAYDFEDKKIHNIVDTRKRVTTRDLLDKLEEVHLKALANEENKEDRFLMMEQYRNDVLRLRDFGVSYTKPFHTILDNVPRLLYITKEHWGKEKYLVTTQLKKAIDNIQESYNGYRSTTPEYTKVDMLSSSAEYDKVADDLFCKITEYFIERSKVMYELFGGKECKSGKLMESDDIVSVDDILNNEDFEYEDTADKFIEAIEKLQKID